MESNGKGADKGKSLDPLLGRLELCGTGAFNVTVDEGRLNTSGIVFVRNSSITIKQSETTTTVNTLNRQPDRLLVLATLVAMFDLYKKTSLQTININYYHKNYTPVVYQKQI